MVHAPGNGCCKWPSKIWHVVHLSDNLYDEKTALGGKGDKFQMLLLLMDFWRSRAIVKYTGIALTIHTTHEKSYFCTSGLLVCFLAVMPHASELSSWHGKSCFWHLSSTSLNHSLIWASCLTPLLQEVCGSGHNFFAGLLQLVRKAVLAPIPPLLCSV